MTALDVLALLDADAERAGKVEALAGAATEGPWQVDDMDERFDVWTSAESMAGGLIASVNTDHITGGHHPTSDTEFIAASRTETPWLVERLRAHVDLARALLDLTNPANGKVWSSTLPDAEAGVVRVSDVLAALASVLGGGEQP